MSEYGSVARHANLRGQGTVEVGRAIAGNDAGLVGWIGTMVCLPVRKAVSPEIAFLISQGARSSA